MAAMSRVGGVMGHLGEGKVHLSINLAARGECEVWGTHSLGKMPM